MARVMPTAQVVQRMIQNRARRVFAGVGRAGFVIGTHAVRGQHDRHLAFFLGDVDLSPDLFAVVIDGHLAHVVLITGVQVDTAALCRCCLSDGARL